MGPGASFNLEEVYMATGKANKIIWILAFGIKNDYIYYDTVDLLNHAYKTLEYPFFHNYSFFLFIFNQRNKTKNWGNSW